MRPARDSALVAEVSLLVLQQQTLTPGAKAQIKTSFRTARLKSVPFPNADPYYADLYFFAPEANFVARRGRRGGVAASSADSGGEQHPAETRSSGSRRHQSL